MGASGKSFGCCGVCWCVVFDGIGGVRRSAFVVLAIVVLVEMFLLTVVQKFLVAGILLLVAFHSVFAHLINGVCALVGVRHIRFVIVCVIC